MPLDLPTIPEDFLLPVRALARAACLLRGVVVAAAAGRPLDTILPEQRAALIVAERVLDVWACHLGLDAEIGLAEQGTAAAACRREKPGRRRQGYRPNSRRKRGS
jgi:hypothetical protein